MILKFFLISCVLVAFCQSDTTFFLNLDSAENRIQNLNFIENVDIDTNHIPMENHVQGVINYTLGSRIPGDYLVAVGSKNQSWPSPHNVAVTLSYPSSGIGKQVTYVAIQVSQSTNLGQAYISKGGLHQRSIQITVESYNTYYMNYSAQIFGV